MIGLSCGVYKHEHEYNTGLVCTDGEGILRYEYEQYTHSPERETSTSCVYKFVILSLAWDRLGVPSNFQGKVTTT